MRRTKIVATIGPASQDEETLARLVEAGLDVARLNFAHGTFEEAAENVEKIRAAANRAGREVAVLQDLPGPKLRIGPVRDNLAELAPGDTSRRWSAAATRRATSAPERGLAPDSRGGGGQRRDLPGRRRRAPLSAVRGPAGGESRPGSRSAARPRARA